MKRLFAILTALTLTLALFGCGAKEGADSQTQPQTTQPTINIDREGRTVAISLPDEDWNTTGNALRSQLESIGYQVLLEYADGSVQTQIDQMEDMIDQVPDCIIVAAVDPLTLADTADYAVSSGVGVIAYDRLITDTASVSYYIAPDYNAMGMAVAEQAVSALDLDTAAQENRTHTLELFMGEPTNSNSVLFYDGVISVLQPYLLSGVLRELSGRLEFEDVCVADGSADTAASQCLTRLSGYYTGTAPDLIITGSDTVAGGVITALAEHGGAKQPLITGMGFTDRALAESELMLTTYVDPQEMSAACAALTDALIANCDPVLGEMHAIYNNVVSVPTYYCGYTLVNQDDLPPPEPTEDTEPTQETTVPAASTPAATDPQDAEDVSTSPTGEEYHPEEEDIHDATEDTAPIPSDEALEG